MTTPAPAHPWIKTLRTILAGLVTAAVLVPLAVQAAEIDVTAEGWRWLGGVLVALATVTRIMQVPAINAVLEKVLRLGSKDVDTAHVVALQVQAGPTQTVVAGDASILPTGTPLPEGTTVGELGQTLHGGGRGDHGYTLIQWLVVVALVLAIFIGVTWLVDIDLRGS